MDIDYQCLEKKSNINYKLMAKNDPNRIPKTKSYKQAFKSWEYF